MRNKLFHARVLVKDRRVTAYMRNEPPSLVDGVHELRLTRIHAEWTSNDSGGVIGQTIDPHTCGMDKSRLTATFGSGD